MLSPSRSAFRPGPKSSLSRRGFSKATRVLVTAMEEVALEKNRVGLRMISGPGETPSDWVTTSTQLSARFTVAISSASPDIFSTLG